MPDLAPIRVLLPGEYPPSITRARGAYTPRVVFAITHPLGLYHVEDHGAGHLQAMFTPKRRGSRTQTIGGAGDLAGALRRILRHEDEIVDPGAPRERGERGPVSMFALGRRTRGEAAPTPLAREVEAYLAPARDEIVEV